MLAAAFGVCRAYRALSCLESESSLEAKGLLSLSAVRQPCWRQQLQKQLSEMHACWPVCKVSSLLLPAGVMAEAGEGLAAPDAVAASQFYKQAALGSHPAGMADYAFFLENGLGGLSQVCPCRCSGCLVVRRAASFLAN